jgi:hypothetical protein
MFSCICVICKHVCIDGNDGAPGVVREFARTKSFTIARDLKR